MERTRTIQAETAYLEGASTTRYFMLRMPPSVVNTLGCTFRITFRIMFRYILGTMGWRQITQLNIDFHFKTILGQRRSAGLRLGQGTRLYIYPGNVRAGF